MKAHWKSEFIFFLINGIVLSIISIQYWKFIHVEGFLTYFYLLFSSLGHFVLLTLVLFFLTLFPFILIYPKKQVIKALAIGIISVLIVWVEVDVFVFGFYRFHINYYILSLIFGGAFLEIFQFHFSIYLFTIFFVVATILLELVLYNFIKRKDHFIKRVPLFYSMILMCLIIISSNVAYAISDVFNYSPILKTYRCFPLHFPLTVKRILYNNNLIDENIEIISLVKPDPKSVIQYPKKKLITSRSEMNIVMIVLDSWNYKCMDSLVTPNIFNFSKSCVNFTNHVSAGNGTREGVFSLFYGINGLYWDDFKNTGIKPVIMKEFERWGYDILTFPSSRLSSPAFDKTVFSGLKDIRIKTQGERSVHRDIQLTKDWLEYLENSTKSKSPFFAFIFYDSMHAMDRPENNKDPFQPTWPWPQFHLLNNDYDPTEFYNLYRNCTHFIDGLVSQVISGLEKHLLIDETIIIITGDHGQEFNDHKQNYWGHNGNFSVDQIGTPLIIRIPGKNPENYSYRTTHLDVSPTLMQEVFNCTNPINDYSLGKNLFDTSSRYNFVVGSRWKMGIIENDRITSMDFNGTYDITDLDLNPLPRKSIRVKEINDALVYANSFYKRIE